MVEHATENRLRQSEPAWSDKQLRAFLDDRRARGLSPATLSYYSRSLDYFARHVGRPLLTLDKPALQRALFALPCNAGGKRAYFCALRAFYTWAEDAELIAKNPCRKLTLKVPKPLRHTVPLGDIPRLLVACESARDRLTVSMLADTGLRLSELASVRLQDIDLESHIVRVWGKGAKQRLVRYGPETARLLSLHMGNGSAGVTLLGLKPRGISIMLYRLARQSGIKCNAHAFRRTFACESVRNGLNLFYVQSLLGHSTLAMTRLYAEQVNSEDAIKAYRPIVA